MVKKCWISVLKRVSGCSCMVFSGLCVFCRSANKEHETKIRMTVRIRHTMSRPAGKPRLLKFTDTYTIAGERMSKRAVDMTFQAIYTLTDLRILLRETAPSHEFDPNQRAQAQRLLENLERQVGSLKQEMLK